MLLLAAAINGRTEILDPEQLFFGVLNKKTFQYKWGVNFISSQNSFLNSTRRPKLGIKKSGYYVSTPGPTNCILDIFSWIFSRGNHI